MQIRLLVLSALAVAAAGCGDDDGGGTLDSGVDGAVVDASTVDRPDGGRCDPLNDTGCPAGMKCTLIRNGAAFEIGCGMGGTGTQGTACQSFNNGDNCASRFLCIRGPGAASATCHAVCDPAVTMCPMAGATMTACQVTIAGIPEVRLCGAVRTCDPLTQTPCTATEGCYITAGAAGTATPQCLTAGTIQPGQNCTGMNANSCTRGSSCFDVPGNMRRCFFHCRVPSGVPMCTGAATGGMNCGANTMVSASFGTCQ